jgi:hypothetical protein
VSERRAARPVICLNMIVRNEAHIIRATFDTVASGLAMFDTARLDRAGRAHDGDPDPIGALGRRATAARLSTASLDEVLCIAAV